jgi:Tol biopolymer transport system component
MIAFASQREGFGGFRLFVMDANGGNPRVVSPKDNPYGYIYPAWSPDGKRIVHGGASGNAVELFVCEADGSHNEQLTRLGGLSSLAAWSPNGTKIAFQHTKPGEKRGSLWIMNEDGSNLMEILKSAGPRDGGRPAWKRKEFAIR